MLVVLLFGTAAWRAARLSLSGDDDAEFLTLILFGTIVGVFLQGFVSWTILDPARSPLALWFLAVLTAETCRRRSAAHPATVAEPDDTFVLERIVNE